MDETIVTLKFRQDGTIIAEIPKIAFVTYPRLEAALFVLRQTFQMRLEEEGRKTFKPQQRVSMTVEHDDAKQTALTAINGE